MEDGPNFCGLLRIQSKLYYFIFVLHLGYWLILTDASIKETALYISKFYPYFILISPGKKFG